MARVSKRVSKGGHGIDESLIHSRFINSHENLKKIINLCDEVTLYDNSTKFREVAFISKGELSWIDSTYLPKWVEDVLEVLD